MITFMPLLDALGQPSTAGQLVDANGNVLTPDKPGDKSMDLPVQFTFSSIISGASQSWIALGYDEAMSHMRENALAMRRDARLMGWLRERKEGTVSRKWNLEIDDEEDPVQVAVRDGMYKIISAIPRFKRIIRWLLEALWYGRYGVQLLWKETTMNLPSLPTPALFPLGTDRESMLRRHLAGGGELRDRGDGQAEAKPMMALRKVTMPMLARPVNGDKINFLWDGTPLIGIYPAWEGRLRSQGADIRDPKGLATEITWDNEKPVLVLKREWRERFIIHTHDPDDADYHEAEKAGGIYGVGIRSRIYWLNWIRMDYAAWVQDLFDRVGLGFIVIKYEVGNTKAKKGAEELTKRWNRKSVLAVPVSADQVRSSGGIEVVDVPTAGALVVQQLIEYADKHLEHYIVGQNMSRGDRSQTEGMGGTVGPAEMAKETKFQLLQADAEELEETLTGSEEEPGLCSTIQKYTYPGTLDKFQVRFRFSMDPPDPMPKVKAIVALAGVGVKFSQASARRLTGEPDPKEGEDTFGGTPPGAAGAVDGESSPPTEGIDDFDDTDALDEPRLNGHANGQLASV